MDKKAVVLLSGGMDSTTCLALAILEGFTPYALHLNYGQLTEKRELQSFRDVCDFYQLGEDRRLVVDISHLKKIGGSALTDKKIKLKMDGELSPKGEIPASYVPFRNAHILSIAVSWAEVCGAEAIFFGAVEEDSSGYPDCRESFIKAFEKVANLGTGHETHLVIKTPLLHLSKAEIVAKANEIGAPLKLTWSCYIHEDLPCGVCESCLLRERGFKGTGIQDLIQTRAPLL